LALVFKAFRKILKTTANQRHRQGILSQHEGHGLSRRTLVVSGCIVGILGACTPDYSLPPPRNPKGVAGPGSPALHTEAVRELSAVKQTAYAHEMTIDEDKGVFDYDCSGFVDYALSNTAPDALETLRTVGETKRPQARTYVELLSGIRPHATRDRWTPVPNVADLLPGDIVAWLAIEKKQDYLGNVNTGHVMIVDAPPTQRGDAEWIVPIIDSSGGHGSEDPRHMPDVTGLGRGTIVLVTENGAPVAYRWNWSSHSKVTRTRIVLGRVL
jgi:hypothetical protein